MSTDNDAVRFREALSTDSLMTRHKSTMQIACGNCTAACSSTVAVVAVDVRRAHLAGDVDRATDWARANHSRHSRNAPHRKMNGCIIKTPLSLAYKLPN